MPDPYEHMEKYTLQDFIGWLSYQQSQRRWGDDGLEYSLVTKLIAEFLDEESKESYHAND